MNPLGKPGGFFVVPPDSFYSIFMQLTISYFYGRKSKSLGIKSKKIML